MRPPCSAAGRNHLTESGRAKIIYRVVATGTPTIPMAEAMVAIRGLAVIGRTYTSTRQPDPRIAASIVRALGRANTVLNVGAGAGAYEPADRAMFAVEPSSHMIRQRTAGTTLVIQASAEALPFRDRSFDAALAVLTLHHWTDGRRGLDEMRRVVNRLVAFTFEPGEVGNFWLTNSYFPEIVELDRRTLSLGR